MILPLFIRVNSGLLAFFCMNYAIKYLPIVLVTIISNTLPLFCSLLGFIILGERITKMEIFCLLISFYGIFVLVYYGERQKDKEGKESNISLLPMVMLVLGPILMAVTNVSLRHMKNLHEFTTSTYSVIYSIIVYGLIVLISEEEKITMIYTLNTYEMLILIFVSLAGGAGMIWKAKALRYEMAGRLSILQYFSIIFTFLFDLVFIGTAFKSSEIIGILIVFLANVLSASMVFKNNFLNKRK